MSIGSEVKDLPESPPSVVVEDYQGSVAVLVLGESGTGKSTSLMEMDPQTTLLIQSIRKPLPFRSQGWKPFSGGKGSVVVCDDAVRISEAIKRAHEWGKTAVVVDDFQYVMANEYMSRAREKGFEKFTEIGQNGWRVMRAAGEAGAGVNVYLLSHVALNDGVLKAKTVGKMVDEKIVVEGMFTVVLRSCIVDGKHYFSTRNNGADTVKSPIGMFDCDLIPNDLALVDRTIRSYYAN